MKKEEEIKQPYERLAGELNERTRRLFAANEAMALGWGGIAVVARATGLSRQVIVDGMQELREGQRAGEGRIRRIGGGRKSNVSKDPSLSEELERLVEPVTRGAPESPLRWTSKSVRKLAKELQHLGHRVSHELVSELLHGLGYRLQVSRKTREGGEHPDRDGQFEHLIPSCDLSEKYERMRKQVGDIGSRRITWPGSHELLLISPQKNSKRDCNWTHVRGAGSAGSSSIMPW